MSTVTLSYTEHSRLRDQEARAKEAERRAEEERRRNAELNERLNILRRQQVESANTINALNRTNDTLRSQVSHSDSRISEMERVHREQRAAMERRINELNRSLCETRESEETFRENVNQQFGAIHVAIGDMNRRLDAQSEAIRDEVRAALRRQEEEMNRRVRDAAERATQTMAELRRYMDDLKPLEPERFYPGKYPVLESQAEAAETDIKNGQMQSALAVAQTATAEAAEMYIRTRVLRQAFDERLEEARVVASHALETLNSVENDLRTVIARYSEELENGCPVEGAKEPDYWNNGVFAELHRRHQEIREQLDHMERNTWTPADLEGAIQNLVGIENEALREYRNVENQLERYFNSLVGGIDTILEVLGDGWECIRYEHSDAADLKSPIQMVFSDGFGHELPMILDVSPEALEQTNLGMTVVGEDVENIGNDRQIILDDIRSRLVENGLRIDSSAADNRSCSTVSRTADTYFESVRAKMPQGRKA